MTVAPCRSTSTRSPVGRLAETRSLSSEIETWGVGKTGDTGIAEGFLERSIMLVQRLSGWRVEAAMNWEKNCRKSYRR